MTEYAIKIKENVFNYIPLTYFVEVDASNQKSFAKAMLPFMNAYYALEDNKKKATKYFIKYDEAQVGHLNNN